MTDVVFMFEVHQPYRVERRFRERLSELIARGGRVTWEELEKLYFDDGLNRYVFRRAAERCYLPANQAILEGIERYKGQAKEFKVAYSVSGLLLEQAERWYPEVVDSFKALADTGRVEFLDQTYYHSLAFLVSEEEFEYQVAQHRLLMQNMLGVRPTAVENTEFIYNNYVARVFARMGYRVVLTEGVERVLGWRSPNYVYRARDADIRVLMRNYRLSDDIGFRFGARWWSEYPLTADKYAAWLAATPGDVILIAVDYETFGEHFPAETGIFEFLRWLPGEILKWDNLYTVTPSEAAERNPPRDVLDVPEYNTISWADLERDLTAWLYNQMQWNAFNRLKNLWLAVRAYDSPRARRLWQLLSTSDHFYYMSTKGGGPGDVHMYFSPYGTSLEAYMYYSEVLGDFETRIYGELERDERARLRYAWLRHVPHDKLFAFTTPSGETLGILAYNMFSLLEGVRRAPPEAIAHHHGRGDFARWIREVVGDGELAARVSGVEPSGPPARVKEELLGVLEGRRRELFGW